MPDHLESDLGAAVFLVVTGHEVLGLVPVSSRRLAFRFADPAGECLTAVRRYFQGASVAAKSIVSAQKDLKALLYVRNGDGDGKCSRRACD
jgi:hypothetical protein